MAPGTRPSRALGRHRRQHSPGRPRSCSRVRVSSAVSRAWHQRHDSPAGIRTVRWQRSVNDHRLGQRQSGLPWWCLPSEPPEHHRRAANTRPARRSSLPPRGDHRQTRERLINSAASPITVDNHAPDVQAVVTAPPAVRGTTLIWTRLMTPSASRANDVLRARTVVAPSPASRARSLLFNYNNAPDQRPRRTSFAPRRRPPLADSRRLERARRLHGVSASHNLAAPPYGAAPVLTWCPRRRSPSTTPTSICDCLLSASTVGATRRSRFHRARGTPDLRVLVPRCGCHPGVLSSSFKGVLRQDRAHDGGATEPQRVVGERR